MDGTAGEHCDGESHDAATVAPSLRAAAIDTGEEAALWNTPEQLRGRAGDEPPSETSD